MREPDSNAQGGQEVEPGAVGGDGAGVGAGATAANDAAMTGIDRTVGVLNNLYTLLRGLRGRGHNKADV